MKIFRQKYFIPRSRHYCLVLLAERTCYIADPDGNLIEIGSFVEG